jgi:quercetin dioxygenase-like cupin family protein
MIASGGRGALAEEGPRIETLLETHTTNLGQPIEYPAQDAARITAVIVTLAPGEETGRHRHPVPLYGQVLAGQVTIDYGAHGSKTYKAGEAFMEAMNTWHSGRNSGDEALRILAVFLGAEGVANVVRP